MIAVLLLVIAQLATTTPNKLLEKLCDIASVVPAVKSVHDVAGEYVPEYADGLSGDQLYLFPDGTYIYCQWADIFPLAILDKGKWSLDGSVIELTSDPEITWNPQADRHYGIVHRKSEQKVLLVGLESDFSQLQEQQKDIAVADRL